MRPVTVTVNGIGNSAWIPVDLYLTPFNVTLAVEVTGGPPTYSVVWTTDDIWTVSNPTAFAGPANLQAATTNQVGALVNPVTAVQLQVTGGSGITTLRVIQSGVMG